MKKQLRSDFNPLPMRRYDLNLYRSYPCFLMDKKREQKPVWHCFVVFSDEMAEMFMHYISQKDECECYCKEVFENDLYEKEVCDVWE